jgi:hypothetical protein
MSSYVSTIACLDDVSQQGFQNGLVLMDERKAVALPVIVGASGGPGNANVFDPSERWVW